jgi:hypothetical protein
MSLKLSKAANVRASALAAWGLTRARFAPGRFAPTMLALAAGAFAAAALAAGWRHAHAPRVWKPAEVPLAFWAWRSETPSQAEVERAARETGARALFLRAGQMDLKSGRVVRVRAWTLAALRWSAVALFASFVLFVFRRTRRARRFLYRRLARHARAPRAPEVYAPRSTYAAYASHPWSEVPRSAASRAAGSLLRVALHERGRAALTLNLFTHGLLTALLWAVLWAMRG